MPERWQEEVAEHRETLEAWSESDLPLSEEVSMVLDEADAEAEATG